MSTSYCVLYDHERQRMLVSTLQAAIEDSMGKFLDNQQPYAVIRMDLTRDMADQMVRSYRELLAARQKPTEVTA